MPWTPARPPRRDGAAGRAGPPRSLVLLLLALLDLAPELLALGDVAQEAAHDLARAGLGQVVGPDDPLGPGELADPLGDVLADLGDEVVAALVVALQGDERGHRLA